MLAQRPSEEGHHLGGQEERVGLPLVAQRRLVSAPPTRAAKGPSAVRGKDTDVIGQVAQPDLQGAEGLQRQVDREMRPEQVGPGDGAEHDRAAREQRPVAAALMEKK